MSTFFCVVAVLCFMAGGWQFGLIFLLLAVGFAARSEEM